MIILVCALFVSVDSHSQRYIFLRECCASSWHKRLRKSAQTKNIGIAWSHLGRSQSDSASQASGMHLSCEFLANAGPLLFEISDCHEGSHTKGENKPPVHIDADFWQIVGRLHIRRMPYAVIRALTLGKT